MRPLRWCRGAQDWVSSPCSGARRSSAKEVGGPRKARWRHTRLPPLGRGVPDDVAVVALNGTTVADYTVPSLTAVRLDIDALSATLAEALAEDRTGARLVPEASLVVRSSCGCEKEEGCD